MGEGRRGRSSQEQFQYLWTETQLSHLDSRHRKPTSILLSRLRCREVNIWSYVQEGFLLGWGLSHLRVCFLLQVSKAETAQALVKMFLPQIFVFQRQSHARPGSVGLHSSSGGQRQGDCEFQAIPGYTVEGTKLMHSLISFLFSLPLPLSSLSSSLPSRIAGCGTQSYTY